MTEPFLKLKNGQNRFRKLLAILIGFSLVAFSALANNIVKADELKPILIQINEFDISNTRLSSWEAVITQSNRIKFPVKQLELKIDSCHQQGGWKHVNLADFSRKVGRFSCENTSDGWYIELEGLQNTPTDALLVVSNGQNQRFTTILTPKTPQKSLKIAKTGSKNAFFAYLELGFEHILGGLDHLMFVVCFLLLITKVRDLVIAITAFTISHSLTLAANTFDLVALNPQAVEAVIALSIVLLAREILINDSVSLTKRKPWLVAFIFGLVHGFGFAGALEQIGLPEDQIFLGLLAFNLGVELGQLSVLVVAFLLLFISSRLLSREHLKLLKRIFLAYPIGIISCVWFLQRLFA